MLRQNVDQSTSKAESTFRAPTEMVDVWIQFGEGQSKRISIEYSQDEEFDSEGNELDLYHGTSALEFTRPIGLSITLTQPDHAYNNARNYGTYASASISGTARSSNHQ